MQFYTVSTTFDLPNWLLRVFVFSNCHAHDFAALFEVLNQLLLVRAKVNIFNKDTARIWVVFAQFNVLWFVQSMRL